MMQTKYALIVMCESGEDHPGGQARVLHALRAAKEFKAANVPVKLFFHGIGVQWLTLFEAKSDEFTQHYRPLFDDVRDTMAGACYFCSTDRFEAGEAAERLGIPLVGDPGDHHTIAALIAEGYQTIVF